MNMTDFSNAVKVMFFLLLLFIVGCAEQKPTYNNFAKCLSDNGAVMYGTQWCSHCQNQKAEFGDSFEYINFIDCDLQKDQCTNAGVNGYPTWIINGEKYEGEQPLYKLGRYAGCEYVSDDGTEQ